MIKLGYKASAEQFGPSELLEYGVLAEELGLDSVWISDHFQPWRHTGGHAPYSLSWLGALGARTKRVAGLGLQSPHKAGRPVSERVDAREGGREIRHHERVHRALDNADVQLGKLES